MSTRYDRHSGSPVLGGVSARKPTSSPLALAFFFTSIRPGTCSRETAAAHVAKLKSGSQRLCLGAGAGSRTADPQIAAVGRRNDGRAADIGPVLCVAACDPGLSGACHHRGDETG